MKKESKLRKVFIKLEMKPSEYIDFRTLVLRNNTTIQEFIKGIIQEQVARMSPSPLSTYPPMGHVLPAKPKAPPKAKPRRRAKPKAQRKVAAKAPAKKTGKARIQDLVLS